jgi:hypothetical protein
MASQTANLSGELERVFSIITLVDKAQPCLPWTIFLTDKARRLLHFTSSCSVKTATKTSMTVSASKNSKFVKDGHPMTDR